MNARSPSDPERDERAAGVLASLVVVREALAQRQSEVRELLEERRLAFLAGRSLNPPIIYRELAKAAEISEPAVMAALREKPSSA